MQIWPIDYVMAMISEAGLSGCLSKVPFSVTSVNDNMVVVFVIRS